MMKSTKWLACAGALVLAGCATPITAENIQSIQALRLCQVAQTPGRQDPLELELSRSELDRRGTDCEAVLEVERQRQEELQRLRVIAQKDRAEELRIREAEALDRQLAQEARVAEAFGVFGAYHEGPIGNLNACIYSEADDRRWRADVVAMTGDQMNSATQTFEYRNFGQYAVVFEGRGYPLVIEMSFNFHNGEFPLSPMRGTDDHGDVWYVSSISPLNCG